MPRVKQTKRCRFCGGELKPHERPEQACDTCLKTVAWPAAVTASVTERDASRVTRTGEL